MQALENEPVIYIEKSRTMMASWIVSGWAAHKMFTVPATGVVFQSEDEARALHDVDNVKILHEQSIEPLKVRWQIRKQSYNYLEMENGSWCIGLPGNPDKIRSEHPTLYVLDEAAHIVRGDESFHIGLATRAPHIVALSSAAPGWFRDNTEYALPVDWPDYSQRAA